mmetsp:Transcript_17012/g.27537  ORF Transcript_17012/g.27537 Transcript_17012/m.27537 type:complete len:449 (+) Transcript_17012:770-2116(+)
MKDSAQNCSNKGESSVEERMLDLGIEDEENDFYASDNAVVESFMSAAVDEVTQEGDDDSDNIDSKARGGSARLESLSREDNIVQESSESMHNMKEGKRVIARFLRDSTCYQIIPESSKVVVFDQNIPIRLAYYALVEHEIGAAPLWDPLSQKLSGIITTLDCIEILRYGFHTDSLLQILDQHSVASWRSLVCQLLESPGIADSLVNAGMPSVSAASMAAEFEATRKFWSFTDTSRELLYIHPDDSLYDACKRLKENNIHWLPIVDIGEQTCLGVVTHLAVLQYLVNEFCEARKLFEQPIAQLQIGTFASSEKEIITATLSTKVWKILDLLSVNHISCVPIVNKSGKPIAVYSRTNVIDLVSHNSVENSLDLSIGSLVFGENFVEGDESDVDTMIPDRLRMHTCEVTYTLQRVFQKFAEVRVHRLLYVDEEGHLKGIVSLSDLLSYFLE